MQINDCGFQRITTSGVIGDSGSPIAVLGYEINTSGVTAGIISFRNGTTSAAALAFEDQGTASGHKVTAFAKGVVLPAGCYLSLDGNTTSATVFYYQVRNS